MQVAAILLPLLAFQGGKLQIKDTVVGKGPAAQVGDYLTMDYVGTLASNGKQFDSSKQPGRTPFTFILGGGQVIKGWDQGIVGMKVGGKRTLTIPASLGYGANGAPPDIPGGATLKFVVELKKIDSVTRTILKPGHGEGAKGGDTVNVLYTGMFKSGKKFDASSDHGGQPMPVQLGRGGVIPGFEMALLGMKAGEKRKVVIPSKLAYGAQGAGSVIPPNTDLVFELEVVSISK